MRPCISHEGIIHTKTNKQTNKQGGMKVTSPPMGYSLVTRNRMVRPDQLTVQLELVSQAALETFGAMLPAPLKTCMTCAGLPASQRPREARAIRAGDSAGARRSLMAGDPATVLASDTPGKYCPAECPAPAPAPEPSFSEVPKAGTSGAASAAPLLAAGLTVLLATLA
jgi:hypothetical protein